MADPGELESLKQRLTPDLMAIDGVSGVGLGADRVHVYLDQDRDDVRAAVKRVLAAHAPSAPVEVIVSGRFSAQ
jgi:hypothetical protein